MPTSRSEGPAGTTQIAQTAKHPFCSIVSPPTFLRSQWQSLWTLPNTIRQSWTKNQVFFLVRFIYSCIYVLFLHAYKKKQSDPINNSCESCSCWELSFWKSSQLLLTTESSLWLQRPCSLNFGSQLHTGSPIECVSHEGFGKVKGFWSTKQKLNQSCCESEFFLPQTLCHCMTFLNTQCAYSTLCMPSGYAKPINTA